MGTRRQGDTVYTNQGRVDNETPVRVIRVRKPEGKTGENLPWVLSF